MSAMLSVDVDLVRKYDQPGPRYTSYPTAVEFSPQFSQTELERELAADGSSARPLSLYVHLPFCETLCWFCGCTTVIGRGHERADRYLDALEREVRLYQVYVNPQSEAVQWHLGGGTPNFLTPAQIARLGNIFRSAFRFAADAEISVEIDPRRLTQEHVRAFRDLGATRASFGIQDTNPSVQQAIHRVQPMELNQHAAGWIRDAGYSSLNVDLIYGLPLQTPASFAQTVEDALSLSPERFAVFSYAHVPWMKPAQKLLESSNLPGAEAKLAMLKSVIETLTARGYVYIGMDHFAREDDELTRAQRARTLQRNFQGYSTRGGCDILGFGMSAISQSQRHYRQNEKTLEGYYARLQRGELPVSRARFLTGEDRVRREVIMRLMCDLELDFDQVSHELGLDFRCQFAQEIATLAGAAGDGLIELSESGFRVSDTGRLLIRNLAMIFDVYLRDSERRFSRTV
jgi:oxygen-independent coproporphyrinogen III oxidase